MLRTVAVFKSATLFNRSLQLLKAPSKRLKSEKLPIKWERPEKLPYFHREKSGDLKGVGDVQYGRFPVLFEKSEELKNADENVKKVFSLEFQKQCTINQVLRKDYIESVKRHNLDQSSPEAIIAGMTSAIRNLQIIMETNRKLSVPRKLRVYLKELIDARKRRLRLLRALDYRRFEWLLQRLDLEYKPKPLKVERVERKRSMKRLTEAYCENVRQERLAEYKAVLEAEQESFLADKIEKLKRMRELELANGLDTTVTDDDVEAAVERLGQLRLNKKKKQQKDEDDDTTGSGTAHATT